MGEATTASEALSGLVAVCVAFLVLNTFFVILRFIARFHVKQQKVGWDDVCIVLGYIFNVGLCADALVIRHYEIINNTPADLPIGEPWQLKSQLIPILKAIYAAEQLLYAGFTFPKLSILFLYLRVFEAKWSKRVTWLIIGATTVCWITFAFVAAFLCQPVRFYWDRTIPGQCINIDIFWRTIPPFNILTDVATLVLPIPIVWKLEASKLKKVGVICIFLTGGVGLITCCIRWGVYLSHSAQVIVPTITGPLLSWAIIEAGVYLIAACLPMMRPILIAITPKWLARQWGVLVSTSTAYHPGKVSSNRASGQVLGGRQRKFNRLDDSTDAMVQPLAGEKRGLSQAGASLGPAIPLEDFNGQNGIHRKVDVSVTRSPAT